MLAIVKLAAIEINVNATFDCDSIETGLRAASRFSQPSITVSSDPVAANSYFDSNQQQNQNQTEFIIAIKFFFAAFFPFYLRFLFIFLRDVLIFFLISIIFLSRLSLCVCTQFDWTENSMSFLRRR